MLYFIFNPAASNNAPTAVATRSIEGREEAKHSNEVIQVAEVTISVAKQARNRPRLPRTEEKRVQAQWRRGYA